MDKSPTYLRGERVRGRLAGVRSLLKRLASSAVDLADAMTPKVRKQVVFGCDKGLKYSGNPRELFEHLAQKPDWSVYWLTKSPQIAAAVNARFPGRALRGWSLKALVAGLRANWLCVSHSRYDLGVFAFLSRRRFVYLNHGVPLKTMGFEKAYEDPAVSSAAAVFGAITCCSAFEGTLWSRAYRLPPERMWVTGMARNDRLFSPVPGVRETLGLRPGQKVLLFAPTYRESGILSNYLPVPDLDDQALLALLEKHDAVLLVRPHYYEWEAARATIDRLGSSRFISADERLVPDVNDLLPHIDILITDYSSIYFDYLLLDRPIVFSCYDKDAYARERGFMIDYDAHTPGQKAATGAAFLEALDAELRGDDPSRAHRTQMRNLFHAFQDDRACERIAAKLCES